MAKLLVGQPRMSIQFWEKNPPSKRDALVVLTNSLALLCESLPIALRHVGAEPLTVQADFWREFHDFDRMTDFTWHSREGNEGKPMELQLAEYLEDLREVVECRIGEPSGDLTEESPLEIQEALKP